MKPLTSLQWQQFCDACCFDNTVADEELFVVCIDYFPFQLSEVHKNAQGLFEALKQRRVLKGVCLQDVQSFLGKLCLRRCARAYGVDLTFTQKPGSSVQSVPKKLELAARLRTLSMIRQLGDQAKDIMGEAYVESLLHGS